MAVYFEKKNWESFVYKRLNQLIDQYKSASDVDRKDQAYVVFDFDNTSVIGDIEDNLMVYMMDNLMYRLSPKDFQEILISENFDMDKIFDENYPQATPWNLAKDIIRHYTALVERYSADDLKQDRLLKDEDYLAFRSKLRYYYLNVNGRFNRRPAEKWLTYWFQGYSAQELQDLTVDMLNVMTKKQAEVIVYETPSGQVGEAGLVKSQFTSGLKAPAELLDLYAAFKAEGIIPYIVSASPIDVVAQAGQYFFQIDREFIRGMNYQFNSKAEIQSIMDPASPITKKEGKTETILSTIANLHGGRQPIALFGDSMGDYHMMTELKEVALNILFNCLNNDQTQEIKELAKQQYDYEKANYVIQGRDLSTLSLIPSTHSINLNHSELIY